MSFTFDQCKDFKRWGYDVEEYGVEPFNMWEDIETIPTLEGVMTWLGNLYGKDAVVRLQLGKQYEPDSPWYTEIFNESPESDACIEYCYGATGHDALYNLAKKVKGE